jgi:hypothetical protein
MMVERVQVGSPTAFWQHHRGWPTSDDGREIGQIPGCIRRINAYDDARPMRDWQHRCNHAACHIFRRRRDRVFQIEDHRISGRSQCFGCLSGGIAGREQGAAQPDHGASGRLFRGQHPTPVRLKQSCADNEDMQSSGIINDHKGAARGV